MPHLIRARELPRDDGRCGWVALLPPRPPPRRLTGRERVDCAVIGAGFTGLATARQLALRRPGWRIAVLEAQRVGLGASGRNSGFVVDVGHYEAHRGVEGNRRQARLGRAGLAELRSLVREHAIECQWSERGRLHGAAGAAGQRAIDEFVAGLTAMGESFEELDAAAMQAATGTSYYRAGARTPGGAIVQPAALVRGLAASLSACVDLYEESPVHSVDAGPPFTLEVGSGTVAADRVFIATNGYTPGLGFLARHIFPLLTFGSLTRPLDDAEQAVLGGEREWGLVCEQPFGATVRRTADQRILLRTYVRYSGGTSIDRASFARVRAEHERSFRARFPMLARVTLETTWSGVMGVTLNATTCFGEIQPGVFASAGYNGVGVALGTIAGTLLADLATDTTSELLDDMRALDKPAWIPPEPLLGLSVRPTIAYRLRRAREER